VDKELFQIYGVKVICNLLVRRAHSNIVVVEGSLIGSLKMLSLKSLKPLLLSSRIIQIILLISLMPLLIMRSLLFLQRWNRKDISNRTNLNLDVLTLRT
jgi:hypothetical protein